MTEDPPRCGLRCHRVTDQGICDWSREATRKDINDGPGLYNNVLEQLYAEQTSPLGDRVSGSRERPLGFNVDALSFIGTVNTPTLPMRAELRDQVGAVPMLDTYGSWARVIIEERPSKAQPKMTAVSLAGFLAIHHDWACEQPWAEEYSYDIRLCAHAARRLCGLYDAPPMEKRGIPCRNCDNLGLIEEPGEDRIVCPACGLRMKTSEYTDWVKWYAAFMKGQAS